MECSKCTAALSRGEVFKGYSAVEPTFEEILSHFGELCVSLSLSMASMT